MILRLYLLSATVIIGLAAKSNVLILTDGNFTDTISDCKAAVVKFHVPWCGHCKNFAPEFEKTAKSLKKSKSPIQLFEVDCSENGKTICSEYNIKNYPTLKVFKFGKMVSDYSGPKHAEGISQQLRSTLLPGSTELKNVAESDAFLNSEDNCVIGFFEPTETNIEAEFHKAAEALKDRYRFAHTYNQRLLARYGYRNEIVIIRSPYLQNKLEPPHEKYEGQVTLYKLRSWITENYYGAVGIRTMMNIDDFRQPLVIVYYNLDFQGKNSKSKESTYWRNRVMLMSRKYDTTGIKQVHFAMSDSKEFAREISDLGLSITGNLPVAAALDTNGRRYVMGSAFSVENLEQFVDDFLSGTLKPYVKSAPLPQSNDGPVKTVVTSNFNDVVMSSDKHLFIFFHSPWCGECPALEKTFEQLAKKVNSDVITLASMDATQNDVPKHFVIKRFPAIFLVQSNMKMTPSVYEGTFELTDLLNYLAEKLPKVISVNSTSTAKTQSKTKSKKIEL